ncbi:MAG: hypothetical protein HUU08_14425 [Candidatus Brocadia sp.]|nr:hypothetical protein [Candidatus Brocadia sp.]
MYKQGGVYYGRGVRSRTTNTLLEEKTNGWHGQTVSHDVLYWDSLSMFVSVIYRDHEANVADIAPFFDRTDRYKENIGVKRCKKNIKTCLLILLVS